MFRSSSWSTQAVIFCRCPPLEVESLPTFMLSLEYLDHSYNHLPGLHVAISWLVLLSCRTGTRRSWVLLAWVWAVPISTLFVGHH